MKSVGTNFKGRKNVKKDCHTVHTDSMSPLTKRRLCLPLTSTPMKRRKLENISMSDNPADLTYSPGFSVNNSTINTS
jgi:hypothetical protein